MLLSHYLLMILRFLLNPGNVLFSVGLYEHLLNVCRHLRVVAEKASNEVVSQELVIVDHLDKIDV